MIIPLSFFYKLDITPTIKDQVTHFSGFEITRDSETYELQTLITP